MNGYKGYFNGKEIEIEAESSYAAVLKAREIFKPSKAKRHMVHVGLCEIEGKQVTHIAS